MNADDIIRELRLEPLPLEGGFFRETYRSPGTIAAHALDPAYGDRPRSKFWGQVH